MVYIQFFKLKYYLVIYNKRKKTMPSSFIWYSLVEVNQAIIRLVLSKYNFGWEVIKKLNKQNSSGLGSRIIILRLRLLIFYQAAPAPDFLPKRLRLLVLKWLRLQGAKNMRLLAALDNGLSLAKYFSPTYECKTAKNMNK